MKERLKSFFRSNGKLISQRDEETKQELRKMRKDIFKGVVFGMIIMLITHVLNGNFIVNAEESRTIEYSQTFEPILVKDEISYKYNLTYKITATGSGYFKAKTYLLYDSTTTTGIVIYSNKSFTYTCTNESGASVQGTAYYRNGVYYISVGSNYNGTLSEYTLSNPAGEVVCTKASISLDTYFKNEIDGGSISVTSDDYEYVEPTYTYNSALDFTHISAEYNLKYTIKKDLTGAWNFITPSEAGIQFHWTNNQSVDNAYLKFDIYGTFYDSMWATSGKYTHITVDGVSKSDCAYLLQQSNLVELARRSLGVDNGHGLDINYIYVQAYGNIDGTFARSRIYKFNNELISDYGNASSEYDEYVPEITSGISLPTDYELDDTLTDPEVVEPPADTTAPTVITTPVDNLDYTSYYDEESLLKALSKFYDMLKSVASTLNQFPTLFANIFSFLPVEITVLICGSLLACIFLRFIGR